MDTEKIVKKYRQNMIVALLIGIAILVLGLIVQFTNINIPNKKGIIALSFLPISIAFSYGYMLTRAKRFPQSIKNLIVSENDERIVELKNKSDAMSFRIIKGILLLSYFGYTFMVPNDIFESVGWWIITFTLLITLCLPEILLQRYLNKKQD